MKSLVFLDVETTGLQSKYHRIIEIFMFKVNYEGEIAEYHTLINPECTIPAKITEITGIVQDDVENAPIEKQVAEAIRQFIDDGVLVAHNLAFDRRFLVELFKRNNCKPLLSGGIDTLVISRKLFPKLCIYPKGEGSHKLKNLMYHFGLDKAFANSHRAKDDVLLLIQVYRHLEKYANGYTNLSYPRAMTHGCPKCQAAMHLVEYGNKRELICTKGSNCAVRLVV